MKFSSILKILDDAKFESNKSLLSWKEQVLKAAFEANLNAFNGLLEMDDLVSQAKKLLKKSYPIIGFQDK